MKLIILDRDGVINFDTKQYITTPAQWKPLPGSLEAIARLTQAGYRVAVATNQSGVGRGLFDMVSLNAIHATMNKAVNDAGGRIDAIFYCPHAADINCTCRKPAPGMLREISERFNTPLKNVPFVGDSLRDLQTAHTAGALPVLVRTGKGLQTIQGGGLPANTETVDDLAAYVTQLVA